jgi:phage repressor protein C with HTH and peptisase S24 domain
MAANRKEFRESLKRVHKTQRDLAEFLGLSASRITEMLDGGRQVKSQEALKMADFLEVPVERVLEIFHGDLPARRARKFALIGYVGAGGQVIYLDDFALGAGMEEDLEPPPNLDPAKSWAVLEVRGDSMYPQLESRWYIWYTRDRDGVGDDCLNRLCVVCLADDDRVLVKKIRRGSAADVHTLESVNAAPLYDRRLKWASPIAAIVPR